MSGGVKKSRTRPSAALPRRHGFTLLEVMISLVVLAIGVMGIIGLQTSTYKQLQTSQNYSKAALLAGDMADRILANEEQALAGNYTHDSPTTEPVTNCGSEACTPAQLADYDVWHWQAQLLGQDPDDETLNVPGSLPAASGEVLVDAGEYIILVRWDDDLNGSTGEDCAALDPEATQHPDDLDCYALNLGCLSVACPVAPPP